MAFVRVQPLSGRYRTSGLVTPERWVLRDDSIELLAEPQLLDREVPQVAKLRYVERIRWRLWVDDSNKQQLDQKKGKLDFVIVIENIHKVG